MFGFNFLPDFTEHPKPKRKRHPTVPPTPVPPPVENDDDEEEISFFHDFVSGGVAGCASVIVGHPFDTLKVLRQTSSSSGGLLQTVRESGGFASLFRGMGAPLTAATFINATVFGSYGFSSRLYDDYFGQTESDLSHDPWQKSLSCGSFAGAVQCVIICPMEHVKCRLQTQSEFSGLASAVSRIIRQHGFFRLYQGWWSTCWREIPAFGLYFSSYDYLKDQATQYLDPSHTWLASALAGGCAGSLTWAIVYPVDVIKTRVQTAPLTASSSELSMLTIAASLLRNDPRILFRGLGVTLLRAFPVNGTIFPVYEFTMQQLKALGY